MKITGRNIALIASLAILIAMVLFFGQLVGYVLIAWVLSMIGQPLMRFFQKRLKIGRLKAGPNVAAALTLICYFIGISLLIWMFVPLIVNQANNLAGVDYKEIGKALEKPANQMKDSFASYGLIQPDTMIITAPDTAAIWAIDSSAVLKADTAYVFKPVSVETQLRTTFSHWFEPQKIGDFFSSIIAAAGNLLIGIFSLIFITFFFLKEQGLFVNFLTGILPSQYEGEIRHALQEISRMLTRYFGGIVIQITLITLFVSASLGILGVKNALLIGFFAALINVIPYLGPLIGATFGVIITISSNLDLEFYNQMLPLLLKVVAVFGAMQMLDNFILQPWIFSNSVLAHPLEIFIVILMGAQIHGIVGMVLAIPAYTVLRVIAKVFLSEFKIVQQLTGGMDSS